MIDGPVDYVPPICMRCKHLNRDPKATSLSCAAFPGGIPKIILTSEFVHTEEYPGDKGIQFEEIEK